MKNEEFRNSYDLEKVKSVLNTCSYGFEFDAITKQSNGKNEDSIELNLEQIVDSLAIEEDKYNSYPKTRYTANEGHYEILANNNTEKFQLKAVRFKLNDEILRLDFSTKDEMVMIHMNQQGRGNCLLYLNGENNYLDINGNLIEYEQFNEICDEMYNGSSHVLNEEFQIQ